MAIAHVYVRCQVKGSEQELQEIKTLVDTLCDRVVALGAEWDGSLMLERDGADSAPTPAEVRSPELGGSLETPYAGRISGADRP